MSWTMYDHERVFAEVREFIVHLEAMRPGACLQPRKLKLPKAEAARG